ncbi:9746_t:CDS:2 [Entrophospora sp. SA101]|nr:9746_t:CDS:2 [Entrophospora sp. SA101]
MAKKHIMINRPKNCKENTLSSDENEALTLSVMVFRLWGLYCKSISDKKVTEGQRGKCKVSELVPLEGQSYKYIEFQPKCIAFHNLPNASFSDGIMMTNPPIFIQDKQGVIDANVGEHIFIFITDAHACDDESYDCNEIVITSENRKDFYGDILAKMKLYCIG